MANKIIISCAITGSIHTPTMSDALPITPDQIATQAIDAANAGAAILHLHARDPKDGRPSPDPNVYMQFLPRIKQATDAVVNITTGGAVTMTVEQRISAAQQLSPEMCSLNMGSMNFALYPMAKRYKTWKYDWEEGYLTNSDAYIFPNTFRDIEKISKLLGQEHGIKFEHECYDVGHLYSLAHCIDRGMFKPPVFVQLIFGILGGIGADLDNLLFMKRTADRLFGKEYLLVGARRRPPPDEFRHQRRDDGRQRARRARGLALYRPRQTRQEQRRAGGENPPHRRGAGLRDRDAGRGAHHAWAQGRGSRAILIRGCAAAAALTPKARRR